MINDNNDELETLQNVPTDEELANLPTREIVKSYNMNERSVRRLRARRGIDSPSPQNNQYSTITPNSKYTIPESKMPLMNNWLKLTGDRAVISCIHAPYQNHRVLEDFLNTADSLGIRKATIIGDVFDNNAFNRKRGGMFQSYRWSDAVQVVQEIFKEFDKCFESYEVLTGNHDNWLIDRLGNEIDYDQIMDSLMHRANPRAVWSKFSHADLISGGKPFKLIHGANYSAVNPLGVASAYCDKYQSNVCMGHQHSCSQGFSSSGFQAIVSGGAFSEERFGYTNIDPRKSPKMQNGFVMITEGSAKLYTKSDFSRWENK